ERYGEIAAVTATTPLRASSAATHPMRRMFVSRSAFENPSPADRLSRTSSPSSSSTRCPRRRSSSDTAAAIVLFPDPDRPVNHKQKPVLATNGSYRRVDIRTAFLYGDGAGLRSRARCFGY